jgi:hypothetical protein
VYIGSSYGQGLRAAVQCEVAGLEEQRFRLDVINVEARQQRGVALQPLQVRGEELPLGQQPRQEGGRAGLEPVGPELSVAKQQQHVEGVVHALPAPVVAVVPAADLLAVQPRQLGREHAVDVRIGVAAQGAELRVQRQVLQVVQPGEQADLAELGHPRQEDELQVRVRPLEHRVQAAQAVAHLGSDGRIVQVVQDGFVVFVHQHHGALAGLLRGLADEFAEAAAE